MKGISGGLIITTNPKVQDKKGGESKMRKLLALFEGLLFATSLIVASGCSKKEEAPKPAAEAVKAPVPEKK